MSTLKSASTCIYTDPHMERTFIGDLKKHVGKAVTINGWIAVRRDQGKLVLFYVRDMTGTVQCVVVPSSAAMEHAKEIRIEGAVAITGLVNQRPEKNIVADKENG